MSALPGNHPPYTAEDSSSAALVALLAAAAADGLHLRDDTGAVATLIMDSRWLWSVRDDWSVDIETTEPRFPDIDSRQYGLRAPWWYWEHDHTALVHVLWILHRDGCTLDDHRDDIAATIIGSRWLAAQRAHAEAEFQREIAPSAGLPRTGRV